MSATEDEAFEAICKTHEIFTEAGAPRHVIGHQTYQHLDNLLRYEVIDQATYDALGPRVRELIDAG